MSAKYHITPDGPKPCRARKGRCPIGGEHYDNVMQAEQDYQEKVKKEYNGSFGNIMSQKQDNTPTFSTPGSLSQSQFNNNQSSNFTTPPINQTLPQSNGFQTPQFGETTQQQTNRVNKEQNDFNNRKNTVMIKSNQIFSPSKDMAMSMDKALVYTPDRQAFNDAVINKYNVPNSEIYNQMDNNPQLRNMLASTMPPGTNTSQGSQKIFERSKDLYTGYIEYKKVNAETIIQQSTNITNNINNIIQNETNPKKRSKFFGRRLSKRGKNKIETLKRTNDLHNNNQQTAINDLNNFSQNFENYNNNLNNSLRKNSDNRRKINNNVNQQQQQNNFENSIFNNGSGAGTTNWNAENDWTRT